MRVPTKKINIFNNSRRASNGSIYNQKAYQPRKSFGMPIKRQFSNERRVLGSNLPSSAQKMQVWKQQNISKQKKVAFVEKSLSNRYYSVTSKL